MAKKLRNKSSETITEGLFRRFYGATTFIEKSAIPEEYGFKSKNNTNEPGYPDFFYETEKYAIVVEVKPLSTEFSKACNEVKFYAKVNDLGKDIFAISMAGQNESDYKAGLFYIIDGDKIKEYETDGKLLSLEDISKIYKKSNTLIKYQTTTLNKNIGKATDDLLQKARLDYVIKMPEHLFSEQGRTVNTSIFGFTKTRHRPSDKVIFYNMQDDGLVPVQHKGRIDKYGNWERIKASVIERIVNNDPNVGTYEMRAIYKDNVLNCYGYKEQHHANVNMVRFDELFNTKTKGSLASEDAVPGEYPFITASEDWKTHSSYDQDKEAIIYAVAASGSLGRCHYINGKFIASNLCLVLTPKNSKKYPINMVFYSLYLNAIRQSIRNEIADGTSKLTIAVDDLNKYQIEYFPLSVQNQIAEEYKTKVLSIKEKLRVAENEIEEKIKSI